MARISGHILHMRKSEWSLSEAKDHLSELVTAARRGQPQVVTRHGKAAVVMVRAEDYQRLQALDQAPRKSFVQHLLDAPKGDIEFERIPFKPRSVEF
jgi:prevent-host-death family protein